MKKKGETVLLLFRVHSLPAHRIVNLCDFTPYGEPRFILGNKLYEAVVRSGKQKHNDLMLEGKIIGLMKGNPREGFYYDIRFSIHGSDPITAEFHCNYIDPDPV